MDGYYFNRSKFDLDMKERFRSRMQDGGDDDPSACGHYELATKDDKISGAFMVVMKTDEYSRNDLNAFANAYMSQYPEDDAKVGVVVGTENVKGFSFTINMGETMKRNMTVENCDGKRMQIPMVCWAMMEDSHVDYIEEVSF